MYVSGCFEFKKALCSHSLNFRRKILPYQDEDSRYDNL